MSFDVFSIFVEGVRNVAFLLPVLQTLDCGRHIGSALTKGFLFASAAPMSLFGSLGIAMACTPFLANAPFLSEITQRKVLDLLNRSDLVITGDVSSLILVSETGRYKVEDNFLRLLQTLGIVDVASMSFSTHYGRWFLGMIIPSFILIILNGTPYLPFVLIRYEDGTAQWPDSSYWIPVVIILSRAVGGFVVVVSFQAALQAHLLYLVNMRRLFMLMDKYIQTTWPLLIRREDIVWGEQYPSTECVASLRTLLDCEEVRVSSRSLKDLSKPIMAQRHRQPDAYRSTPHLRYGCDWKVSDLDFMMSTMEVSTLQQIKQYLHELEPVYFPSPRLHIVYGCIRWIILLVGVIALLFGYVGSFVLVTNADGNDANTRPIPVIWLAAEVALTLLRSWIWSVDPKWDEYTHITLTFDRPNATPPLTDGTVSTFDALNTSTEFQMVTEAAFHRQTKTIIPYISLDYPGIVVHYGFLADHSGERGTEKNLFIALSDISDPLEAILFTWDALSKKFIYYQATLLSSEGGPFVTAKKRRWITADSLLSNEIAGAVPHPGLIWEAANHYFFIIDVGDGLSRNLMWTFEPNSSGNVQRESFPMHPKLCDADRVEWADTEGIEVQESVQESVQDYDDDDDENQNEGPGDTSLLDNLQMLIENAQA